MDKASFSSEISNLITMIADGSDYECYCMNNDLNWFVPQLKVMESAFKTGLFLKEELLAFFSLPPDEYKCFKDEMVNLCTNLEQLNTPLTAVKSRRTLH